jgi:hypothetical protein
MCIDEILDAKCFRSIGDWIERQLDKFKTVNRFHFMYLEDREAWTNIPDLFSALSRRK